MVLRKVNGTEAYEIAMSKFGISLHFVMINSEMEYKVHCAPVLVNGTDHVQDA